MKHEPDTTLWPPEQYKLWLRFSTNGMTARLLPKTVGETLEIADLSWQRDDKQTLHRIEDAVYEEHIPIDIYDTEIELETPHILVAPTDSLYDEDVAEDMFALMYAPDGKRTDDVLTQRCGDVTFIYGLPMGLKGFLDRTFCCSDIRLALAKKYTSLMRTESARSGQHLHLFFRPGVMDVLAFSGGILQLANNYAYTEPEDAAYYILNAWQTAGLSQLQGYLHIHAAPGTDPAPLRALLADYINHIQ